MKWLVFDIDEHSKKFIATILSLNDLRKANFTYPFHPVKKNSKRVTTAPIILHATLLNLSGPWEILRKKCSPLRTSILSVFL